MILEYERRDGSRNTKIIDLLTLTPECVQAGSGLAPWQAGARVPGSLDAARASHTPAQLSVPPTPWLLPRTDLDLLCDQIVMEEPLISEARKPQLRQLLDKLTEKLIEVRALQGGNARARPVPLRRRGRLLPTHPPSRCWGPAQASEPRDYYLSKVREARPPSRGRKVVVVVVARGGVGGGGSRSGDGVHGCVRARARVCVPGTPTQTRPLLSGI